MPDEQTAESIARLLIEAGHAACVSIGAPIRSLYHWDGKFETATEIPLTIKTTASAYATVEAAVRSLHPYQLPEIIAIPVTTGLAPYLAWIAAASNRSKAGNDVV